MKYLVVISIVVSVVSLGLGGYLIKSYGSAQYDLGQENVRRTSSEQALQVIQNDIANLKKRQHETQNLKNNELDMYLDELGILRDGP